MADAMPKHRNHRPFQIAITVRLRTIASRGFFLLLLGFLHVFYISATFARATSMRTQIVGIIVGKLLLFFLLLC